MDYTKDLNFENTLLKNVHEFEQSSIFKGGIKYLPVLEQTTSKKDTGVVHCWA